MVYSYLYNSYYWISNKTHSYANDVKIEVVWKIIATSISEIVFVYSKFAKILKVNTY